MSFSEPLKAVIAVASDRKTGIVLWYDGPLAGELDAAGNEYTELGFPRADEGIHVWEGVLRYDTPDVDGHCDGPECAGRYRAATRDEWEAIREGRNPWVTT